MALTDDEYLAALKEERDDIQAKLASMAADSDYSIPGAAPNSSSPVSVDHGELYNRLSNRLTQLKSDIQFIEENTPFIGEGRGIP